MKTKIIWEKLESYSR